MSETSGSGRRPLSQSSGVDHYRIGDWPRKYATYEEAEEVWSYDPTRNEPIRAYNRYGKVIPCP